MAPFSPFRASTRGEKLRWYREKTGREQFPLYSSLDSARHAPGGAWVQTIVLLCRKNDEYEIPAAAREGGGQIEQSRPGKERPFPALPALVLFFTRFLASTLAS